MRVLFITTHLNIGGIPVYTVSLAKALSRLGNGVAIASGGGKLVTELESAGILHINIPIKTKSALNPALFFSAIKLRYTLSAKRYTPDIIHTQTRVAGVVGFYLSRLFRIPFVTTCHGFFRNNIGRRFFPSWGSRIIAISSAVQQELISEFNLNEKKIRLIHNGIDVLQFSKILTEEEKISSKRKLGIPSDNYCLGVISRLVAVKGVAYFLRAFAKLVDTNQYLLTALIVGEGRMKDDLKNLAKDLGVSDKVIFIGSIYPAFEPLSIMDIFVFPSIWEEGFGLSILEAMAMGVPVVAFDTGGVSDIIRKPEARSQKPELTIYECGILVELKDIDGLCEAMSLLLQDADLRKRMGESGRRIVYERFSIDKTAEKTYRVYEEAIEDIKNYSAA